MRIVISLWYNRRRAIRATVIADRLYTKAERAIRFKLKLCDYVTYADQR